MTSDCDNQFECISSDFSVKGLTRFSTTFGDEWPRVGEITFRDFTAHNSISDLAAVQVFSCVWPRLGRKYCTAGDAVDPERTA